jgi:2'-5' RNA ligase
MSSSRKPLKINHFHSKSMISYRNLNIISLAKKKRVSCLVASLPADLKKKIKSWAKKNIKKEDLYFIDDKRGYEIHPHVTIKYGLYTNVPEKVKEFIKHQESVDVRLGKISKFRDISDKFDVIKIEVYGPDLQKLNRSVSKEFKHDKGHQTYLPHITLAYIKKGTCEDLVSNKEFSDAKATIDKFVFLDHDSEPHPMYAKASRIDFPQEDLPDSMWNKIDGEYVMKPNVEKKFEDMCERVLSENFKNYKSFYVTCLIGCSVTTQFWKKGSDIDLKMVFNRERFIKQNPKYVKLNEEQLIEAIVDVFDKYKYKMEFNGHPIEFYPEFEEHVYSQDSTKRFESLYDINKREWIKPVKLVDIDAYDRDKVIEQGEKDAIKWACRWDLQLGNIKRKVKEFELVKNYVKTLDKERKNRFKEKMNGLLSELKSDIEKLNKEKKMVKEEYNNAYDEFNEDLETYYGSVNSLPEVIRIKMLNMWGYLSIIKLLKEIVEDQPAIDKHDVKEINKVLNNQMKSARIHFYKSMIKENAQRN